MKFICHVLFIFYIITLLSCRQGVNSERDTDNWDSTLDSIACYGNIYDLASYLSHHPEFPLSTECYSSEYVEYMSSLDGKFRVYSILPRRQSFPSFKNIIQYEYFSGRNLKLEMMDGLGCISEIGICYTKDKIIYLPITYKYSILHGTHIVSSVRAFTLDKHTYELNRAPVFKTKAGKFIDTIDVLWNSRGGSLDAYEDDFYGLRFNIEPITSEVYVQVVPSSTGIPTDEEIAYLWDGCHFTYSGIVKATDRPIMSNNMNR